VYAAVPIRVPELSTAFTPIRTGFSRENGSQEVPLPMQTSKIRYMKS